MNPKNKGLDVAIWRLTPIPHIQDTTDIDVINVLDTKAHDVIRLQQQDAYWKCIHNTLHIPWVKNIHYEK